MPLLAAVATVVLVVFLLWFAVGTQRNISRGNNLLRWLQDGLGDLGPRTTLKWRGSSVAQLDIVDAVAPFAEAQVSVVLEPRDVVWLWAWSHQRGRRDLWSASGDAPLNRRRSASYIDGWRRKFGGSSPALDLKSTLRLKVGGMSSTIPPAPTVEDPTTDHEDDVAAIKQVIADIETGFNTNDPDLSVKHFTRNASAVNVVGVQLTGREALFEANRAGLAGHLRDESARYEVQDIVFLRRDVAIAHKHAWAIGRSGDIDVGHSMVALYVLVKEDDRWWIAARQNTLVQS